MSQTVYVENDQPKPVIINVSKYRDDQPSAEEREMLSFVPSTVQADDGLAKGITPVDKEKLDAAMEDERVERKFQNRELKTVEERFAFKS